LEYNNGLEQLVLQRLHKPQFQIHWTRKGVSPFDY